jgi:hypothetical protein
MCHETPPPPETISTVLPETDPTLTLRERFIAHSKSPSCAGCHSRIDPFGFAMENYDPIGRFRELDNGKPVDASGAITFTRATNVKFRNGVELIEALALSPEVHQCYVRQVFRYMMGRIENDGDDVVLREAFEKFTASNLDSREIILSIVGSDAFRFRKGVSP